MSSDTHHDDAIAVIGLACRFPGSPDPETFWRNIRSGHVSIVHFSEDELREAGISADIATQPNFVAAGGILEEPYAFDASLFRCSAGEAALLDPQHRIFLECAWEALESAGYAPGVPASPVGVFAGCSISTHRSGSFEMSADGLRSLIAHDKDYLATRVAYKLNLRGPALTVQTACSTSLVAVHLAVQSLLAGECEMALAGGVTVSLPQAAGYLFQEGMILSSDGFCRPFDERATGVVGGNGAGIVALKRLSTARRDGNPIRAIILGSAINNDGADKVAFTAPSLSGQARVVSETLAVAGVTADSIGYVEAHGTGTPIGDPVEIQALTRVFRKHTSQNGFCALGSVKGNVGHLDAAAGVASLIKAVLIAERGEIPPLAGFRSANPRLELDTSPFYVPASVAPWPTSFRTRRVGVSSFGFGGTNAHLILEQPPEARSSTTTGRVAARLLTLSAQDRPALGELARAYGDAIAQSRDQPEDICFTSHVARRHFDQRLAVVGSTLNELVEGTLAFANGEPVRAGMFSSAQPAGGVVFLFTGQGAQYAGMARELVEAEPAFQRAFHECRQALAPFLDLSEVIFGDNAEELLKSTRNAQPALFAIEYALAAQLKAWGIVPTAVMGHSLGEYVAACVAGSMTLREGLELIVERAKLMESAPGRGGMLSVFADRGTVDRALSAFEGRLSVAAVNGVSHLVISGDGDELRRLAGELSKAEIVTRALDVSHAFHSPFMETVKNELESYASGLKSAPLSIPFIDGMEGKVVSIGESIAPSYWAEQLVRPVDFVAAVRTLVRLGHRCFVEVGPRAVLTRLGQELYPAGNWIDTLTRGADARRAMAETLARLYACGLDIDWSRAHEGTERHRVVLPTYRFAKTLHGRPVPSGSGESAEKRPLFEALVNAGAEQAVSDAATLGLDVHLAEEAALENLCSAYVRNALGALGAFEPPHRTMEDLAVRSTIAPRYLDVLHAMAASLHARGELARDAHGLYAEMLPASFEDCEKAEREAAFVWRRLPALRTLVQGPGRSLADVLSGRLDPRELFFQSGDLEAAYRIYAELPTSRYFNGIVREVVRARVLAGERRQTLSILEIGAGTGATTEQLLPLLDGASCSYTFTDVSPLFLDRAREKFGRHSFIELRSFDLTRSPAEQGFATHHYDLVVASNAVHAAPDLRQAMQNVRALLTPGGVVVLYEITSNSLLGHLTTGLLMPRLVEGDVRGRSTFLDEEGWQRLLGETGFVRRRMIPDRGERAAIVGERIIVAQAGGVKTGSVDGRRQSDTAVSHCREELFIKVNWEPHPPFSGGSGLESSGWILCEDGQGVARQLADSLRSLGSYVEVLRPDVTRATNSTPRMPRHIPKATRHVVYLRGLDAVEIDSGDGIRRAQERCLRGLIELIGELERSNWSDGLRLTVVTRGAQSVKGEASSIGQAALVGLARVAALGHPELDISLVDLDPRESFSGLDFASLLGAPGRERVLARRDRELFVPRLQRARADTDLGAALPTLRPDRSYLIAGGRGGLGGKVAEWLAERGARHLVLLGRSAPTSSAIQLAESLGRRGITVTLERADVTDVAAMTSVVQKVARENAPLGGVIHAALHVASSDRSDWASFADVLAPKVTGALVLHEATLSQPLDFFVLFSSAVSLVPTPGLPAYVAANTFLDTFAAFRRAKGLPGISISWGAWSDVGTVADPTVAAQLSRGGLRGLTPTEALSALGRAMGGRLHHVGILDADWPKWLASTIGDQRAPIYAGLVDDRRSTPSGASEARDVGREILALAKDQRLPALRGYLCSRLSEVLRCTQAEVGGAANLMELGLDSLMFLGVAARISQDLGVRLPTAAILRDLNLGKMAEQIVDVLDGRARVAHADPSSYFRADPEGRYQPFALNEVQQAYWLGRQPDLVLGNIACHGYVEIDATDLDVDRLEVAWNRIVRRHDMLRAAVTSDGMQCVLAEVQPYRPKRLDLSHRDPAAREAALLSLRAEMSHRVPDPLVWPLFEIRVTKVDAKTTRIHVSLDNLVLDGRSTGILLREWSELYARPDLELPALEPSSRDYLRALSAFEQSDAFRTAWQYWEQRLTDMPLGPDLPLVLDPGSIARPKFTRRGHRIAADAWTRLKKRAGGQGVTPSGVLLGAYAEVLSRWARKPRFTLSVPSFQRIPFHPQVDDIVGEFTTLVLLVVDGLRGGTFAERAKTIQDQLLQDLEHACVNGVRVLRELRRTRGDAFGLMTPVVFTSLFGLERETDTRYASDAARTAKIGQVAYTISQTPQVLLDHHVHETAGELEVFWDAVEEAFAPGVLDAMFESYVGLLSRAGANSAKWRLRCSW